MGTLLLTAVLLANPTADASLAPWSSNRHPTDTPRHHVQLVTEARAAYAVHQGGTMDGRNCRSPQGVWQPFEQTWESNRAVRMENVGRTEVVKPWLSNGQNDFRSLEEIVARAVVPGMSEREKAMALWWQEVQYRFHFQGDNNELLDPVKIFNVYGYNTCGNDSIALAAQWRAAGLRVAPARVVGHCVTQVFYDGRWHLLDGDMHSMYLLRDNETIAGEQDVVRDHDLIRRTHTQGILQPDRRAGDEWEASLYVFEGQVTGDRNSRADTAMHMTLRPGEAITWRWGHLEPVKYHGMHPPKFPERVCNGLWEYRPDFSDAAWRQGADTVENVIETDAGLAAEQGRAGTIIWSMRSPYVFVGGELEVEGNGVKFSLSWDGRTWHNVGTDLDQYFRNQPAARYRYYLKCELSGDARLRTLAVINDLQMAPLTLPGMAVGENAFTYTDESPGPRNVRITHHWVERSATQPPAAPARPIHPANAGATEGTAVVFQWQPAHDPEGDEIADYHFELSDRPDMKWPLSMSFAKLISRTADAGSARYTLPEPGLLNPDQTYYWHVRAKDAHGVWGPWSETWTFTPRGPAHPLEVTVDFDAERNSGILRWTPNPLGRKPAAYRVYASDEKGFSVSDEAYDVTVGTSKQLPSEFPPNFVVQTEATALPVLGPDVTLPAANKAFYRVVAVDASGNHSGPSDYAAAPRPIIYTQPVTRARRGAEYRYAPAAIRSLGDLRMRILDGRETLNFWDIERLRFSLERAPDWLSVDETNGELTGTPAAPGKAEVVLTATLEADHRRLDEETLKWGREKVISTGTETVGTATQRFVIDVAP